MKIVQGDLIKFAKEGNFDVIVHGCNCFCAMGSGIALGIKQNFPGAYYIDLKTIAGDKKKLGTYTKAILGELTIVNAYTQYDYKGTGILADYNAINKVFRSIAIDFEGKKVGIPKIGAGLAKGNWEEIEAIIKNNCEGMVDLTLVEYRK